MDPPVTPLVSRARRDLKQNDVKYEKGDEVSVYLGDGYNGTIEGVTGSRIIVKLREGTQVDKNDLADGESYYNEGEGILEVESSLVVVEPFFGGFYKTDVSEDPLIGCRIARSRLPDIPMAGTVVGYHQSPSTRWYLVLEVDGDYMEMDRDAVVEYTEAFRSFQTPFQIEVGELGRIPMGLEETSSKYFDEYFQEKFPGGIVRVVCVPQIFEGTVHIQDGIATVTACLNQIRKQHDKNEIDVVLIFASSQAVGGTGGDGHLVAALVISLFFSSVLYNMYEERDDRTCQPMVKEDGSMEYFVRHLQGKSRFFLYMRVV